jgi:hypothetical protein
LFAPALVDDEAVGPDYSIRLERSGERGTRRPIAILWRGARIILRSRSNRRILRALASHLTTHQDGGPQGLALHATPLIRDQRVVLAPRALVGSAAATERLLTRAGAAISDGPAAVVMSDPLRVVVDPLLDAFDAARLPEVVDHGEDLLVAQPGDYDLAGVAVGDFPFAPDISTPARAVQAVVGLALDMSAYGGQAGLELVASIVEQVPVALVNANRVRAGLSSTLALFDPPR